METIDAIHKRRSIKKFLTIPVEQDKLGVILDAGRLAPNAGNIQDWRFVLIRNKSTIEGVARACLHQMWIASAPAIIVVGSKGEKTEHYYKQSKDFFITQSCAAAAMNMIVQATDLGLATTWVSAFDINELKGILGMPGEVTPQVVIPIGYGDEEVPEPSHYKLENLIFLEGWGNKLKDADWVLQNYNYLGRAINGTEKIGNKLSNAFKDIASKIKKDKEKKNYEESVKDQEVPEELKRIKSAEQDK